MAEYIEREAVIDLLKEMRKDGKAIPWEGKDIFSALRKLPAADVRPVVRGRWVYNSPDDNIPYCSECLMPQDSECNYCPSCGADMKEKS